MKKYITLNNVKNKTLFYFFILTVHPLLLYLFIMVIYLTLFIYFFADPILCDGTYEVGEASGIKDTLPFEASDRLKELKDNISTESAKYYKALDEYKAADDILRQANQRPEKNEDIIKYLTFKTNEKYSIYSNHL